MRNFKEIPIDGKTLHPFFNGPVIKRKRLYNRNLFFQLVCMSRPWVFLRNRNWKIVSEFLRICHFKSNQIPFFKRKKEKNYFQIFATAKLKIPSPVHPHSRSRTKKNFFPRSGLFRLHAIFLQSSPGLFQDHRKNRISDDLLYNTYRTSRSRIRSSSDCAIA